MRYEESLIIIPTWIFLIILLFFAAFGFICLVGWFRESDKLEEERKRCEGLEHSRNEWKQLYNRLKGKETVSNVKRWGDEIKEALK